MRLPHIALIAAFCLGSPVAAQDILTPLKELVEDISRPQQPPARPAAPAAEKRETPTPPPIPRPRPEPLADEAEEPEEAVPADEDAAVPVEEPDAPSEEAEARVYQTACPALIAGLFVGEMLPPIAEGQCVERSPVLMTALNIGGRQVELASPITTNCALATRFVDWASDIDAYSRAMHDKPLAVLETGSSFVCRNRYSAADGFVSEHGFANAIDLSGFTLEGGEAISVKDDWEAENAPAGKFLRQAHGAACGKFTTVLGPEANAEHEDHLHFDLGCHGGTCTAQICE
jgi:hypothetical protein